MDPGSETIYIPVDPGFTFSSLIIIDCKQTKFPLGCIPSPPLPYAGGEPYMVELGEAVAEILGPRLSNIYQIIPSARVCKISFF